MLSCSSSRLLFSKVCRITRPLPWATSTCPAAARSRGCSQPRRSSSLRRSSSMPGNCAGTLVSRYRPGLGAALGDVEHLVEGEDAQADEAGPGALGEGAIEPGAGVQALEFGESEAAHRVLGALREDLGDVGGALQGVVVEGDQYAVAAALHVGFQVVGAEVAGQQVGRGGFLGASYEAPRWAMTAGQGTPAAALRALPDGSAAWAASPAVRPRRPRVLNVPCQNLCRMRRLSFFLFTGLPTSLASPDDRRTTDTGLPAREGCCRGDAGSCRPRQRQPSQAGRADSTGVCSAGGPGGRRRTGST